MTLIIGHSVAAWANAGKSLADLGLATETKERENCLHVVLLVKLLFFRDAAGTSSNVDSSSPADLRLLQPGSDALVEMLF